MCFAQVAQLVIILNNCLSLRFLFSLLNNRNCHIGESFSLEFSPSRISDLFLIRPQFGGQGSV